MTNLGKIYKIKNLVNQKEYVGCTISTLRKRFEEHIFRCTKSDSNTKLCNSIRKYGSDKFIIELIEESWENMTEDDRNKRIDNIRKATQKNSKYSVELIKEVKDKLNKGIKVPQLVKDYPNMNSYILYDIKNNRRWKNI
jgi:DNA polymerase II small subunit/DNA polymerase delta subunit B